MNATHSRALRTAAGWIGSLAVATHVGAASPIYVVPDVPTHETLGGTDVQYWQLYKYDTLSYTSVFSVPGSPLLADIHRMDAPGSWLFALETPSNLSGSRRRATSSGTTDRPARTLCSSAAQAFRRPSPTVWASTPSTWSAAMPGI